MFHITQLFAYNLFAYNLSFNFNKLLHFYIIFLCFVKILIKFVKNIFIGFDFLFYSIEYNSSSCNACVDNNSHVFYIYSKPLLDMKKK